jgi:uncharacterized YccA/Bax inhibitor family protein
MLIPYFGVMFYMFLALSAVCEGYFVPAIDIVVVKFQIPNDIAGATLMVSEAVRTFGMLFPSNAFNSGCWWICA